MVLGGISSFSLRCGVCHGRSYGRYTPSVRLITPNGSLLIAELNIASLMMVAYGHEPKEGTSPLIPYDRIPSSILMSLSRRRRPRDTIPQLKSRLPHGSVVRYPVKYFRYTATAVTDILTNPRKVPRKVLQLGNRELLAFVKGHTLWVGQ